jgi:hypothetical protein
MKRRKASQSPQPLADYGLSLQTVVSRRSHERKAFFVEPRRWHDELRSFGPGSRKH